MSTNKLRADFATFLAEMLEDYAAKMSLATGEDNLSSVVKELIAYYRIQAAKKGQ